MIFKYGNCQYYTDTCHTSFAHYKTTRKSLNLPIHQNISIVTLSLLLKSYNSSLTPRKLVNIAFSNATLKYLPLCLIITELHWKVCVRKFPDTCSNTHYLSKTFFFNTYTIFSSRNGPFSLKNSAHEIASILPAVSCLIAIILFVGWFFIRKTKNFEFPFTIRKYSSYKQQSRCSRHLQYEKVIDMRHKPNFNKDKYEILLLSLIFKDGKWQDYPDICHCMITKEKPHIKN